METAPSRLQQLLSFYAEDPNDPFTIYALAMEYRPTEPQRALEFYQKLLTEHPDYVGTYYHAGKLLEQLQKPEEAEKVYRTGLVVCRRAGQRHAGAEVQQALNQLLGLDFEDE
ncbi:tetratricopeptide repeat protein [Hymenobacter sp. BT175]|uniref:tetratricopeptide repeat protein n=1 Tax=Hymenobacter translucens TaxID=2886507 RepID=UPI001D0EE970|nr:tetratricopeptide repeat protein [Hymenobacter translucens]MCC2545279.1 tetratricopeptide repeat protein [Hymenobacter translucens]